MTAPVYYAIPTANPDKCAATFAKWRAMGYRTAALIDGPFVPVVNADLTVHVDKYEGYAHAVNILCERLADVDWLITGGDDVFPDRTKRADEIAAECTAHFGGTFGVMQPAGDKYGALEDKSAAVSPWLGRDFRQRVNGGNGPYWEDYRHFYSDTELAAVATRLGCMWWRDEIVQFHDHWIRKGERVPEHLVKWQNNPIVSKPLFERRRAAGFPGHELLEPRLADAD
jgi:hypothetical protein